MTLRYDRAAGKLLEMRGSLSGTLVNCAGGTTPWGSRLSHEEIITPAGHTGQLRGKPFRLEKPHGFVFDVDWVDIDRPADGVGDNGRSRALAIGVGLRGSLRKARRPRQCGPAVQPLASMTDPDTHA